MGVRFVMPTIFLNSIRYIHGQKIKYTHTHLIINKTTIRSRQIRSGDRREEEQLNFLKKNCKKDNKTKENK